MPTQLYASVNGTRLCYFERGERTDTAHHYCSRTAPGSTRELGFIIDRLPDLHTIALTYAVTVVAGRTGDNVAHSVMTLARFSRANQRDWSRAPMGAHAMVDAGQAPDVLLPHFVRSNYRCT